MSRSSSINSANNTPQLSPKDEHDTIPFSKRKILQKDFHTKPLVQASVVRKHLKETYSQEQFFGRKFEFNEIKKKEPEISKNYRKVIKNRISIGDIIIEGFTKYRIVTIKESLGKWDILLLNNGTAVYNAYYIPKNKQYKIAVGTTRAIRNDWQHTTLEEVIDNDFSDFGFLIDVLYTKKRNTTYNLNPLDIIGVIKTSDALNDNGGFNDNVVNFYTYWQNFIEETYKLSLERHQQTGGKKSNKYLYIGKSRKTIYTINGKKCVRDGKHKNGKIKYVSVNGYKKRNG